METLIQLNAEVGKLANSRSTFVRENPHVTVDYLTATSNYDLSQRVEGVPTVQQMYRTAFAQFAVQVIPVWANLFGGPLSIINTDLSTHQQVIGQDGSEKMIDPLFNNLTYQITLQFPYYWNVGDRAEFIATKVYGSMFANLPEQDKPVMVCRTEPVLVEEVSGFKVESMVSLTFLTNIPKEAV